MNSTAPTFPVFTAVLAPVASVKPPPKKSEKNGLPKGGPFFVLYAPAVAYRWTRGEDRRDKHRAFVSLFAVVVDGGTGEGHR